MQTFPTSHSFFLPFNGFENEHLFWEVVVVAEETIKILKEKLIVASEGHIPSK